MTKSNFSNRRYSCAQTANLFQQSSRVLALVAILLAGDLAYAQFLPAELHHLSTSAAEAGSTIEVSVAGNNLDEARELIFSHPEIVASVKTTDPQPFRDQPQSVFGQFNVTVGPHVPPGRYETRVRGRHGISNPRLFLVSPVSVQSNSGVAHDASAATPISMGKAIASQATAAQRDYFQFEMDAGQSIRIDLIAQAIDSQLIGHLQLITPDGRVAASSRGFDAHDPSIAYHSDQAGTYRIVVSDFIYRGGDNFHYVLSLQEQQAYVDLLYRRSESGEDSQSRDASGQLPLHLSPSAATIDRNVILQTVDCDQAGDSPIDLTLPVDTTFCFPDGHQSQTFRFEAQQAQSLVIEVISNRADQPTDGRIVLLREEPQDDAAPKLIPVVDGDDSQGVSDGAVNLTTRDPIVAFTASHTATYRLLVRDLDIGRSLLPQQLYRLRIGPAKPDFELIAYRDFPHRDINQSAPHGSKLMRGGAETIRVLALRKEGFSGPIEVRVDGLPAGVKATPVKIAANQNQTSLTLAAGEEAEEAVAAIRLIGRSEDGSIEKKSIPTTIVWGKGNTRDLVRSRISTGLSIAVSANDLSPITIELGSETAVQAKPGETLQLPVRIDRREGGNTPIVLRARDFPPGVSGGDVTIAADKNEGSFAVKLAGNVAPGNYSLWLQAETKIKIKPNPQALTRTQTYRSHLQTLRDDPANAEKLPAIDVAIAEADKQIEAAKPGSQPRELTVFIPTSNATLQVVQP